MVTLLGLLGALAVVFAVAVVATREGPVLVAAEPDRADLAMPESGLSAGDLTDVRFSMTLRGYRMSEVDAVLDRAIDALAQERERNDRLTGDLSHALDALRSTEGRVAALQSDLLHLEGGTPSGPPTEA